jgi:putative nucleotidyltransferase with HDIG domain
MSNNVLIVQKNQGMRDFLVDFFTGRGKAVTSAAGLRAARREIRRARPGLLILDLQLLDKRGVKSLRRLKRRLGGGDILLTGNASATGNGKRPLPAAQFPVLTWPFGASEIEHALRGLAAPGHGRVDPAAQKESPPRVRVPLRLKITAPYALLSVALAMAGAFIATRILFDTIEERFTNQLIEAGKLSTSWIVQEEERLLETLRLLTHSQGIVQEVEQGNADSLRSLLFPIVLNGGVEAVEVLNGDGISVLSLRHVDGGLPEEYAATQDSDDFQGQEFVEKILTGTQDSQGDKFAQLMHASWGDFLYFAGPILDADGAIAGAVLVGESLQTVAEGMRQATMAQATLYDSSGQPLATTYLDDPVALGAELAAAVLQRQESESLVRGGTHSGIQYTEIFAPLEVRAGQDVGLVSTALPQSFLVQASAITRWQVFAYATVGFLLVIAVGVYVARRLTTPLQQLLRASSKVAQGELGIRVSTDGNDEVAALAYSFNRMISAVQMSKVELLDAHGQLMEAYDKTIEGWSAALELRDEVTEGHTQRVADLTVRLAREMGVTEADLVHVRRGALLHDIGKMALPDELLKKPGPLTPRERAVMEKHPVYAHRMLYPIAYLRPALAIPCLHHERWDGTGYPLGLRGEKIPFSARIFAVVDVWDALTSDRPYRKAWSQARALAYMKENAGAAFDPQVVDAFIALITEGEKGARMQEGVALREDLMAQEIGKEIAHLAQEAVVELP